MSNKRKAAGLAEVVAAVLAVGASAGPLSGQISDVSPLCAATPQATGASLFTEDAAVPVAADSRQGQAATDLYCIELFSTVRGGDAAGVVALGRPWSPFGVTVTPEGRHRHALTAWIERLPDPTTLGPYTTYIAWATPLALDPVVKLGVVGNGRNALGEVAFNKYLILVTAEVSTDVTERTGPIIIRGRSPSSRMEAHDLMALAPAAEEGVVTGPMAPGHDMGAMGSADDDPWPLPPSYEGVPMLPGVMESRPRGTPFRPTPVDPALLPSALPRTVVDLPDGGTLDLTSGFVKKRIDGRDIVMMAFNGQIPGPLVRVGEASTIFVNFTNETPMPTAVHWHGIRLDNRFDGVPGVTQEAVQPGQTFRYQIHFKDPGIYWYHPHHREDVQQELGLAGNMLVEPISESYYNSVDKEEVLMLDDLLLSDDDVVAFGAAAANYMLMGRFGNIFLTNGEPEYGLDVDAGEVVRFHLTNASNTRTFNLSFRSTANPDAPPLPLKVVASDVGRFERETMAGSAVLAPAERYVIEVHFPEAGAYTLTNHVQGINHRQGIFLEEVSHLGTVAVSGVSPQGAADPLAETHSHPFATLRAYPEVIADIDRYRDRFDSEPDHELVLTLEVDSLPMVIAQSMSLDWVYFNPVEWTGTMPIMNWATSSPEIAWLIRDPRTGAENEDIDWRFRVGDVVKVRVVNDREAFHAMQHPLHIHGQRFLVLEQNGVRNENMVWKDTVLLPTGSTTDILLELSNPGRWMVHCHIAEHLESGMKFVFDVEGN
ncbi:MAG: multicopper oxidase family protein [Gemmatimonadetes bacterium]|nr:multicopper oxidase family protein [Gemmatimonadota bacterium]MDA1103921.1 multicopper oxidase family protein [Gemmatimonadota bacterium]